MGENFTKPWHKEAIELWQKKNGEGGRLLNKKEITDRLAAKYDGINYNTVKSYIMNHGEDTIGTEKIEPIVPKKFIALQSVDADIHKQKWSGNKTIKFGLMGDTQLGSKYTQITHLWDFYQLCKDENITDIYHTGDITDGLKMRPGHEYELYTNGWDEMIKDVVKNYPKINGLTTHFITGNHDASIYKHIGMDIGKVIASERSDLKYLGRDCAQVYLTPECILEMRHPWDGTAYAQSYKPQKMIEAMESDSKPNILAIGHYHKAEYLFYRNVHCFQTGCFQGQTPFTRGKGISVALGGWIIEIEVDDNGYIQAISQKFVPYYSSIKDDYKNWR